MSGRLNDGFSTTIAFSADTDAEVWEKTVTPPGVQGGGPIDTTDMRNTTYRTKQPKQLIDYANSTLSVSYSMTGLQNIIAMINVNQLITVTVPDGSTMAFWGYIDSFIPGDFSEGEQPVAEMTIIPTNENSSGVETAPVITVST